MFARTLAKLAPKIKPGTVLRKGGRKIQATKYSIFLKQNRTNPLLQGLKPVQRSRATAEMYKALSKPQLAALEKQAKATFFVTKRKVKKARKLTSWAKFVKANYSKVKHLPNLQRLKKLGQMWKAARKA